MVIYCIGINTGKNNLKANVVIFQHVLKPILYLRFKTNIEILAMLEFSNFIINETNVGKDKTHIGKTKYTILDFQFTNVVMLGSIIQS